jgi:hypothetical protein
MDSLHLNQSSEIPPIPPNRIHENVEDFDFYETSTATFANMTTTTMSIRRQTSEVNSYLNDSANKNLSTQPTPLDKKELSEIMAPIMQTLHEQYKQNLEIQHENELAKEIRQIYCQVSVLRKNSSSDSIAKKWYVSRNCAQPTNLLTPTRSRPILASTRM